MSERSDSYPQVKCDSVWQTRDVRTKSVNTAVRTFATNWICLYLVWAVMEAHKKKPISVIRLGHRVSVGDGLRWHVVVTGRPHSTETVEGQVCLCVCLCVSVSLDVGVFTFLHPR